MTDSTPSPWLGWRFRRGRHRCAPGGL